MSGDVTIRRGDIWWVSTEAVSDGGNSKMRPAVVLTADGLNRARCSIVIVPLSLQADARPPIVVATPSAGPQAAVVCDQLRAIDKALLVEIIGRLAPIDLRAVQEGVRSVLEL